MSTNDQNNPKQLKGFYGKVKVSVKTLDILIGIATLALVLVIGFGLRHRGYTITFDSTGGTPIESQLKMYGELVDVPEDPTREGYTFDYWSQDENGQYPWDMNIDEVVQSMTLYANWTQE